MSIEKSVEIGKASKEEILAREGYTAELEKLSMLNVRPPEYDQANILADKPAVPVVGALSKRSQSQPKKSTEGEAAVERTGSSEDETDKKQKSRSTSRGLLSRLQGKKEEHAEKKEEEKVVDETTKPETEITEPVLASTEAAPVLAGGAAAEVPVVGMCGIILLFDFPPLTLLQPSPARPRLPSLPRPRPTSATASLAAYRPLGAA